MNSVILCEGSTDYVLLQYFMRKAYLWEDEKEQQLFHKKFGMARVLKKENNFLSIVGCRGCNNLIPGLEFIIESNKIAGKKEELFEKIVIVTDRDEVGTEESFIEKIKEIMNTNDVDLEQDVKNNQWIKCKIINSMGDKIGFELLLLVIPFDENGALETFLLSSISKSDKYEKQIIDKCQNFVDNVDEEKKYLNKRRYITKAKFDVYFSVRTPVQQYVERQNILKNVEWEKYMNVQKCFENLGEI